jgi:hypothetical protein
MGRPGKITNNKGRIPISDDDCRNLLKAGWFFHQIQVKYRIGLKRLRALGKEVLEPDQNKGALP